MLDKRREALEEEVLLRGPSTKEIQKATEHLPPTEVTPPKVNIDDMVLQTDVSIEWVRNRMRDPLINDLPLFHSSYNMT